jgi:hypothetical protein
MKRASLILILLISIFIAIGGVKSYPQKLTSDDFPDFEQTSFIFNVTQNGVGKVEAAIRNNGSAPATTGAVPSTWEKVLLTMTLSSGEGTINESFVDFDIDGDGDKADTFDVRWSPTPNRSMDATVDGDHVYSLYEDDGSYNFSVNGISKYFQLGSDKQHAMYYASEDYAEFMFDVVQKYLPNPTIIWKLSTWDLSTIEHVTVTDFTINGEAVEVNLTHNSKQFLSDLEPVDERWYVIPNQAFEIGVGETVDLSCILTADRTVTIDLGLIITWSLDNINRFWRNFIWEGLTAYTFEVNEPTTTTSATLSVTTSTNGLGFSFLPEFALILLIAFSVHKKKYKKLN